MLALTHGHQRTNIHIPLTHSVVRIGVLKPQRHKPLSMRYFYAKNSVLHLYVGLSEALERVAGSLGQYANFAQSDSMIGVMLSGLKKYPTEAIMPKFHAQEPTKNPLTLSVSETKQKTLLAQVSIIRSAINIHGLTQTQENFSTLKADALELVRMLDEIEQNNQRKTSLFNVLAKGTRRVIAERVGFNQAIQYPNAIVKFAGMELAS